MIAQATSEISVRNFKSKGYYDNENIPLVSKK
jgi:hypothetical protein